MKYQNRGTGEIVEVKDDGMWMTLPNGGRIKKETFFATYSEVVNPDDFFTRNVGGLAAQLSNEAQRINTSNINDLEAVRSGVIMNKIEADGSQKSIQFNYDPQNPVVRPIQNQGGSGSGLIQNTTITRMDEKTAIIQNYLREHPEINPADYKQVDEDNLDPNTVDKFLTVGQPQPQAKSNTSVNNPSYPYDPVVTSTEINQRPQQQPNQQQPQMEKDEAYEIFKKFKNKHNIKIKVSFDTLIADPEFLKMMCSNFDADYIKYYVYDVVRKIYKDPSKFEKLIYDQIYYVVYGEYPEDEKVVESTKTTKKVTKKKPITKKATKSTTNSAKVIVEQQKPIEKIAETVVSQPSKTLKKLEKKS
jgi:hypothetical protein